MQIHQAATHGGAVVFAGATGTTFTEFSGALGGIIAAVIALLTFAIGIARNNRKNKQLAQRERRAMYRRGYRRGVLVRDRELQPIVALEAYWRTYIAAARDAHPDLPAPSPPTVVLPPSLPDLGPDDTDDESHDDGEIDA